MTATATDDAWMETCLIAISKIDKEDIAFQAITETVDFDLGEKDIEGVPILNGGRVTKFTPEGDSSVTFEAYPMEVGTISVVADDPGTGFADLMHTPDNTIPIRVLNTRNRDKYRVLFLWTNDTTATTADSSTAANASALRIGLADGYFTSVKPSFTDGVLKYTVTFKCAAFDKAAVANILQESAAGSAAGDVLPAIAKYTTSCKFD